MTQHEGDQEEAEEEEEPEEEEEEEPHSLQSTLMMPQQSVLTSPS